MTIQLVDAWVKAGFEVLTAVLMNIHVFWDMMPCRLLVADFVLVEWEGDFCHSIHNARNTRGLPRIPCTVTFDAGDCSETLTVTHRPALCRPMAEKVFTLLLDFM